MVMDIMWRCSICGYVYDLEVGEPDSVKHPRHPLLMFKRVP